MSVELPFAKIVIHKTLIADRKEIDHEQYEGELIMSDEKAQEALKILVGDGNGKVTVSREISESNYGNGGRVFVSVTLTCDQSIEGVDKASEWANHIATTKIAGFHEQLKSQLIAKGIIKA